MRFEFNSSNAFSDRPTTRFNDNTDRKIKLNQELEKEAVPDLPPPSPTRRVRQMALIEEVNPQDSKFQTLRIKGLSWRGLVCFWQDMQHLKNLACMPHRPPSRHCQRQLEALSLESSTLVVGRFGPVTVATPESFQACRAGSLGQAVACAPLLAGLGGNRR
jgi:hypothetical protein